ncbi:MAG: ShlB/FhaC/HecB family hemolysin secretion/activation protein [Nitrospirae bacterium]|nr:ShlB/FhaC/HecB family hemolysin secretion/activation protein [Nitrospirota bacterium]
MNSARNAKVAAYMIILPLLVLSVIMPQAIYAETYSDHFHSIDPSTQQNMQLAPLPELRPEKSAPDITLPDLPEVKDDGLSSAVTVYVNKITIKGNTILKDDELSVITNNYIGREISYMELEQLRRALTECYIKHGFINSGVVIPDQKVENGELVLSAIEGKLTEIEVEGNKSFSADYIRKKLRYYSGTYLNVNELQQGLQIMLQNPMIQRLNAELIPGLRAGEGTLKVKVQESQPLTLIVEGSNDHSPSIGSYGGDVFAAYRNLTGHGDIIRGSFTYTQGLMDGMAEYAIPLSVDDTTLKLNYRQNETIVIEDPFKNLDIKSRVKSLGVTLSRPFYKTTATEFTLGVTSDLRFSETFLLGRSFSFTEGISDGRTNIFVLRFFQEWSQRSQTRVIAARCTISVGVDAFNSTMTESGPDGKFLAWLGQVQWIERLFGTLNQLVVRTDAQYSKDPLLPLEKFSIGGMDSVRGYRNNVLVRDNGIFSSLEFRIPIYGSGSRPDIVQLVPFFDYGYSWNTKSVTPAPKAISGTGLGIKWAITDKILFQIYGAHPFRNVSVNNKDLQDRSVYFKLTTQVL